MEMELRSGRRLCSGQGAAPPALSATTAARRTGSEASPTPSFSWCLPQSRIYGRSCAHKRPFFSVALALAGAPRPGLQRCRPRHARPSARQGQPAQPQPARDPGPQAGPRPPRLGNLLSTPRRRGASSRSSSSSTWAAETTVASPSSCPASRGPPPWTSRSGTGPSPCRRLKSLTLTFCCVNPSTFLHRCPCLRKLPVDCYWNLDAVAIRSESLEEVAIKDVPLGFARGMPRRVDVDAPLLNTFSLICCGNRNLIMKVLKSSVEDLSFKYCSVSTCSIGYAPWILKSLSMATESGMKYGQVNLVRVLSLVIIAYNDRYHARAERSIAEEIACLPANNFTVLKLELPRLEVFGIGLGRLVSHLLQNLNGVQRLQLVISQNMCRSRHPRPSARQASHPNVSRLEIHVPRPERGLPASQISSLLRAAEVHKPEELVFDVGGGEDDGDVPFELPCFTRATSMDLGTGSSPCRRLELQLKDVPLPNANYHTPRRVSIVAPMLKKFKLQSYGHAEMIASFSEPAPMVETLSFRYCTVSSRCIGFAGDSRSRLLSLTTAMEWRTRYGQLNPVRVRVLSLVILVNNVRLLNPDLLHNFSAFFVIYIFVNNGNKMLFLCRILILVMPGALRKK
ncbi:hypothetical protein BAE44_0017808 [Dichanthelium oligosanthes]|uniref:FBD domain-containing protein n=1 Tax=Dichanthelium oligosanthes TaxID=888268 RepID=A0A1E5V7S5_9POAL|nr:hypothetical protein BAE44_0017808 [Dichanthelium oligosanthes]